MVLLLFAFAVSADERDLKRQRVAELLEVIDTNAMTRHLIDHVMMQAVAFEYDGIEHVEGEERAEMEKARAEREKLMRAYRDQLSTRIDYRRMEEEVYVPVVDSRFTTDDLQELIAFFKTRSGQKLARALPELAIASMVDGTRLIHEAGSVLAQEIEAEDARRHPWKQTMSDMYTLAMAIETYATDQGQYPDPRSLRDLSPTYLETVPEKDAWGKEFRYVLSSDKQRYRIISAGEDGMFEWDSDQFEDVTELRVTKSMKEDIIFQDGDFVQYPDEEL